NNKNYIYLLGSDRLSKELHFLSEKVNNAYANLELDYRYNAENDKNDFYSRSDHYNFANNNIPVIFYFTGEHPDYHKPTDTPDKIDYQLLEKRSKLIFATAWQIANQKHKLVLDTENELLK
ncbi:MAG TPA: M28 family peptidase, partial [Mariniflexile sp.]|nr:M28 family peptidase [Mariniflexile sp.]